MLSEIYDYSTAETLQNRKVEVKYTYGTDADAGWNRLLTSIRTRTFDENNAIASSITETEINHIGNLNVIRYRGYYYDVDMGLYYLQSRYYDASIGRFINADAEMAGVGGEPLGCNLFAYCFNNPVNMDDGTGN